jgi:hypothetical protein
MILRGTGVGAKAAAHFIGMIAGRRRWLPANPESR